MSERYTVISSDCHAGLECEEYRPYLEARHHPAFESSSPSGRLRDEALKLNYEYIMNWETHNEEGLRGAWDAEQRDKELDADGVSAEVIFADSDAITGKESPPFGAGLSAGEIRDPELASPAPARTTGSSWSCARRAPNGAAASRSCRSSTTWSAVEEIEWVAQQPGIRGIMIPTMWRDHTPYNDPSYDPVWAVCAETGLVVHTHSGEAPREEYNDQIGIYLAEVAWWAYRPNAHLLFSARSSATRI